ncbi:MAG: malate synthase, partial [Reichenbachiella sp.]
DQLLAEEYQKLLDAGNRDVHNDSKITTLPIAREIVKTYLLSDIKGPWYIDLLNLNLNNQDLEIAKERISKYYHTLNTTGQRITKNLDFEPNSHINA